MIRVLLGQPSYGGIVPESYTACQYPVRKGSDASVHILRRSASLLAHAFNLVLAHALNENYDYFGLVHGDIVPEKYFVDTLLEEMRCRQLDVIHGVSPIKDDRGLTSTALAYSDDEFGLVRRLTVAELASLPQTFDIRDVRTDIDAEATHILPNTGCILMPCQTWLKDFPGFTINDRVVRGENEWAVDVCSEDWQFGYWCKSQGVNVGCTKALNIQHYGTGVYDCSKVWGQPHDQHYFDNLSQPEVTLNAY